MTAAILKHLFRRNCYVPLGELVAVTQCHRQQLERLMSEGKIERGNNHASGEEYRINPAHRRDLVARNFDEYGNYGQNNPPLEPKE